jgi:hypothetical protein
MKCYIVVKESYFELDGYESEVSGVYASLELAKKEIEKIKAEKKEIIERQIVKNKDEYEYKENAVANDYGYIYSFCFGNSENCCDYWYISAYILEKEIEEEETENENLDENTAKFIVDNFETITGYVFDETEKLNDEMIENIRDKGVLCNNEIIELVNWYLEYNQNYLKYYDEKLTKADLLHLYGTCKKCPHCNSMLIKSGLTEYAYTCISCDEDFYECEVR